MANVKISSLGAATELITEAVIPGSQGLTTKKFTIRQIQSEYTTNGVGYTVAQNEATFNGTLDKAFSIGYNLVAGTSSTKIEAGEPQIKWDLEADWNDGAGTHWMEANVNYQGTDGTVRRPFGIFINRATHDVKWWIRSGANKTMLFSDDGYISIGNAIKPTASFDFNTIRSFPSYGYGVYNKCDITSTTQHCYGFYNSPRLTPADGKQAVMGSYGGIIVGSGTDVKTAYSLYVGNIVKEGVFTVSEAYGLYVEPQTIGTTNYSLYVSGGMSRIGSAVGINSDPAAGTMLKIAGTAASAATYVYGLNISPTITSSTQHAYGISVAATIVIPTAKDYYAMNIGSPRVTYSSGGTGNAYLLHIENIAAVTGTMTNQYGIYIDSLTTGGTNYGIYVAGTHRNYIGGTLGMGVTAPTAVLHLKACTAAANTASLKIDAGTVADTPVSGNIESDGTHLYWTDSGGNRKQLDN